MSDRPDRDRESLRKKAQQHFTEKENRKAEIFREMETERSLSDAKTAKLRALRLAKEAADAAAAEPATPAKKKKRPIVINTH
jgi:UDP:flavonoid glycosyltransferase YjiC (YdhE family)